MMIAQLNADFAIPGRLSVVEGVGGLPMIKITSELAEATISLYGGQVLSFQPAGQLDDLLFLSDTAYYAQGKAIKGGVPICWPWFGPDPDGKGRPGHGFVRNRLWTLLGTENFRDGSIQVRIGLSDTSETRTIWDFGFELELQITIATALDMVMITRNTGTDAFPLSQALHTYLAVGDISMTHLLGLEGCTYIDKMDDGQEKVQSGVIVISEETDRIYTGTSGELTVEDLSLKRRITITSKGSNSAVVWNPWAETAASMGDLGDDDFKRMICVETTNAGPDVVNVAPGRDHVLAATYALSSL
jgi:glucose-6-phosphate 1-epimerase